MKKVVVIGGGISGLAAAYFLKKKGTHEVTLLEKENRVGGWIRSVKKGDFLFEEGAKTFRESEKTTELIRELKLDVEPVLAKKKYLLIDGRLQELDLGLLLKKGACRAVLKDLFAKDSGKEDESIGAFFSHRFGIKFTMNFVDPLVRGIFGGDLFSLSMRSCFPNLYFKKGSLFRQVLRKPAMFFYLKEGMEALPKALEKALGEAVRLEEEVVSIEQTKTQLMVQTSKETIKADHVVLAIPSFVVPKILHGFEFVNDLPFLSVTTLHMGFEKSSLKKKGFGYLVPKMEKEDILGVSFDSEIFSKKKTSLCVMIAGEKSEEEALEIGRDVLKRHLDIDEAPTQIHHHVARKAIPQYGVGYFDTLKKLKHPQISFIGSSFCGSGVHYCLKHSNVEL